MASSTVKVTTTLRYGTAVKVISRTTDEAAKRAAHKAKHRAQAILIAKGRVDTGRLLASIQVRKGRNPSPLSASYHVGSKLDYAIYQEKGVHSVHARPGGVLAFKPKGLNMVVFAKHTSGFRGAHFLEDAVKSLTKVDFIL